MSPIELLAEESQQQHLRYHQLYGTSPVRGDGLRDVARLSREVARQAVEVRQGVLNLNFSTAVTG
ncbi:MAG: hypothetical protein EKK51_09715 [Mycolicibacterium sp.]|uniref:hypothetical protein n=1 Tax=Mycobacteriaceae TaxID=1762 RepID=UPI000F9E2535|nr:hypothetical protein [Mycolicibacterium sp.]RUP32585.1 MAG: hypothetical protein EKK51_09715 [Mycolicibacterium sp.]